MNNNEKIKRAEQLIAEANALLKEVKAVHDNGEDVIAKYKENYCKGRKYFLDDDSEIRSFDEDGTCSFEEAERFSKSPYQHYLTEELAEQAKKLKDFNDKLLAFKYCYDLDYKPDWDDTDTLKYMVYHSGSTHMYDIDYVSGWNVHTVYFSSKEIAKKCVDWLNVIDPDGELIA